jgi:NADH:ubiquinone oxidoreductase subunit 3 (subunit A)
MIGLALALIAIGIVMLFLFPWVGIPVGIVGLILFVAYLAGFGRRAAEGKP